MKKSITLVLLLVFLFIVSQPLLVQANGNETAGAQLTWDEDGKLILVETGNGKINADEDSTAGDNPIEVAGS